MRPLALAGIVAEMLFCGNIGLARMLMSYMIFTFRSFPKSVGILHWIVEVSIPRLSLQDNIIGLLGGSVGDTVNFTIRYTKGVNCTNLCTDYMMKT